MEDKEDDWKFWGKIVQMFKTEYWAYANKLPTLKDADLAAAKAIIELIKSKLAAATAAEQAEKKSFDAMKAERAKQME